MNAVYLTDCMEFMATLPDKHYDLAIVDPPYGIGEAAGKNASRNEGFNGNTKKICMSKDYGNKDWDNEKPKKEYFAELFRVSQNQIIWGGNYFIYALYETPCFIVWDKDNGNSDFADCELAWTSFKSAVRKIKHRWNGLLQENMKNKERRIHPTQKPIALYKWLLQNYAKPGWTIFDSHVGSGSLRIACHDLGFDFEGCEIDRDYWEAQEARYQNHIKQDELFEKSDIQKLVYKEALLNND